MKKTTKTLRLDRHTITALAPSQLMKAAGGRTGLVCNGSWDCSGSCNNCTLSCACGTNTADCDF